MGCWSGTQLPPWLRRSCSGSLRRMGLGHSSHTHPFSRGPVRAIATRGSLWGKQSEELWAAEIRGRPLREPCQDH